MTRSHTSAHAEPPGSVQKSAQFDAKKAVADVPAKADRLSKAVGRVRNAKNEEAAALVARDREWARFAHTFFGCATTARGVFIGADELEPGESLFPSSREV